MHNGITLYREWDELGRPTLVRYKKQNTLLAQYNTSYDTLTDPTTGKRQWRQFVSELDDAGHTSTATYIYDALGRLVAETRNSPNGPPEHTYQLSYTYDEVGNRIFRNVNDEVTSYEYDEANRLTSQATGEDITTYTYDDNGNLYQVYSNGTLTTRHTWDEENQLTHVYDATTLREEHTYAGDGLRRSKRLIDQSGNSTTSHFLWDDDNLLQEYADNGSTQAHYTDHPGLWGGLSSMRRGSTSHYYGFDTSANTRFLTDGTGALTDHYHYRGFGETLPGSGTTTNPHRYSGQVGYYQENDGRHFLRSRHYDVGIGRFTSADPLGFTGGDWNLYTYCYNDPINWIDALGLAPQKYALYVKLNPTAKKVYTGRTSGPSSSSLAKLVRSRDLRHHMTNKGYRQAIPVAETTNRSAIRGLEQRIIDYYGGAQSEAGTSGNPYRGIRRNSPRLSKYIRASKRVFGGAAKLSELLEPVDKVAGSWMLVLDFVDVRTLKPRDFHIENGHIVRGTSKDRAMA